MQCSGDTQLVTVTPSNTNLSDFDLGLLDYQTWAGIPSYQLYALDKELGLAICKRVAVVERQTTKVCDKKTIQVKYSMNVNYYRH